MQSSLEVMVFTAKRQVAGKERMSTSSIHRYWLVGLCVTALSGACAGNKNTIPGTSIPNTNTNKELIARVEEYRTAMERRDHASLILMASSKYWEDSGSPGGEGDYGFEGLKNVLATRLQQAEAIRYSLKYVRIRRRGCDTDALPCQAFVDVLIDASYSAPDSQGNAKRYDKRDQNQLVLEWDGEQWQFLSGM